MSPPLGQGPRESPEQYRARKALEKVEQHKRLRIAIASRLLATVPLFVIGEDGDAGIRSSCAEALRVADVLIEEAGK